MHRWILFFLLLIPSVGTTQMIYSKFMKHWEGGDVEYGYGVVQAPDGDFVVTGYLGTGADGPDACVMKLDPGGTPVWIHAYGGSDVEAATGVRVMRDGGLVFAGHTSSFGSGLMDVLVTKVDVNGAVLWARAIGGPGDDYAHAIDTTQDGGVIVCGTTFSFGAGNSDFYILKLDAVGNLQWSRVVGGPTAETAFDVVATADGGYAVSGQTVSFGVGATDYYLVKLNAAGAVVYTATYGGGNHDFGYRLGTTADDHLLLCGYTMSFGVGSDGLLLKVSLATGALVWARNYGSVAMDRIFDVFQASDGNYVATGEGTTSTFGAGDEQVIKVAPNGGLLWARHYGTAVDETGYGVGVEARDQGIVVVGWDDSAEDIFVNKMDSVGDSGCNNAAIAIAVGTPVVGVGTGGVSTTGGIAMNIIVPMVPVSLVEVPYCSAVLAEGELVLRGERRDVFNRLFWEIAGTERYGSVFLERGVDGEIFDDIVQIDPVQSIGYYDDAGVEAAYYYRMRRHDQDGRSAVSNVVWMEGGPASCLMQFVHPDGRAEVRRIAGMQASLPVDWSVVDGYGRVVARGHVEDGQEMVIDLKDGASGIYLVQLRQAGKEFSEKLLLR